MEYGAKEIGYRYLESRRARDRKTRILVAAILADRRDARGDAWFLKIQRISWLIIMQRLMPGNCILPAFVIISI